ncbi:hypothetical protein WIS52_25240 [Pseudonocardia nematodicida]|uniref:WD40 repeat n=1 Tax=Pseudonocardia nematodicida TaxID=1206997 RepID=A0ABV1KH75_9PSEU
MPVETFWDGLERRLAGDGGIGDLPLPEGVTAVALRRVLDSEAHHLRHPDLHGRPATAAQQVLAGAVAAGEDALAAAARDRISDRGLRALAGRWRTRPASPGLRRALDGHGDAVTGLALDADGRLLSVDASGQTGAWDTATGLPAATDPLAGGTGPERAVAGPRARAVTVSGDGGLIGVAGPDHVVRVLAVGGITVAGLRGHSAEVTVLAFATTASGATRLVSGSVDGTLRIWDVATGTAVAVTAGHAGPVRALTTTGPGTVVSAGADGTLRTWDAGSGALLAVLEGDVPVTGVTAAGPETLVAGTADGAVHAFTVTGGLPHDPVRTRSSAAGVTGVVAAGAGRVLVTRDDGAVEVLHTGDDGSCATVLTGHRAPVRAAAVARVGDSDVAITGDDHGRILVWDLGVATAAEDRPGLASPVAAVAVTRGLVVSAARGGALVAHDRVSGDERWRSPDTAATHLWCTSGGGRLFTAAAGIVTERHAVSGVVAGSAAVTGTVLAGRGTLVVLADGDRVAVADARSGRVLRSARLPTPARRAALTPGGSTVLLGTHDALTAWRPAAGELSTVALPPALLTGVALDDDGCHALAADADGRAHLWTVGTDTVTTRRADPVGVRAATAAAGHRAVTAGAGGTVALWELADAALLARAPLDAPLTALAVGNASVVVGDGGGDTHVLDLLDGAPVPLPAGAIPAQGTPVPAVPAQAVAADRASTPDTQLTVGSLPEPRSGTPLLRRLLGG